MHPWRSRLERLLGPIARNSRLSPNTISAIALALNLLAAVALSAASEATWLFLVVPAIVTVAGLLDALDGLVARLQGKSSLGGDFLDHFADRVSDSALIAGWTIGASVNLPLAVFAVFIVGLTGNLGTQIEATFRERSYEGLGRGEFVLTIVILPLTAYTLTSAGLISLQLAGMTLVEWLTAVVAAVALLGLVQRLRLAARLAAQTDRTDA